MAVRNVLPGQKRHLFPLSCYPAIRIYIRFTLNGTETDFKLNFQVSSRLLQTLLAHLYGEHQDRLYNQVQLGG